ncbi:MAG: hypothetical protein ACRDP8_03265 [Actinopolymorphaceae bacterium]
MHRGDGQHRVDHELFTGGVVLTSIGAVLAIVGGIALVGTRSGSAVPYTVGGLILLTIGVRLLTIPTARATTTLDASGVTVRSTKWEARIPWAAVDHWGLAKRPIIESKVLVLWPTASRSEETVRSADKLWSGRRRGWVLSALDPSPELINDIEKVAPVPRHDAAVARGEDGRPSTP